MDIYYVPSNLTVRAVFPWVMERTLHLEANGLSSRLHKCELNSCVVSLYSSSSISPSKRESEHGPHRSYEDQIQQYVMWQSCSFLVCLLTLLSPLANWHAMQHHEVTISAAFSSFTLVRTLYYKWELNHTWLNHMLEVGSCGRNSRHAWIQGHR